MKKLFLGLILISSCSLYSADTRNMILLLDWGTETVAGDFTEHGYDIEAQDFDEQFGPVTQSLMAALAQKAAPIVVSATTWGNAVERGKIFDEAVHGRSLGYLKKYRAFNTSAIKSFQNALKANFNSKADQLTSSSDEWENDSYEDGSYSDDGSDGIEAVENYYACYKMFFAKDPTFKPKQWIVKKLSDYLYLLVPNKYINQLTQQYSSKDLDALTKFAGDLGFSQNEWLLGLKLNSFANMTAEQMVKNFAPTTKFSKQYKELIAPKWYPVAQDLTGEGKMYDDFMFGHHLVWMLRKLLLTRSDLQDEVSQALFLHEWIVYLDGHGDKSAKSPVSPLVGKKGRAKFFEQLDQLAGMEIHAFQDMLQFFNRSVYTGAFLYTTCFSGGHHLFKLFEQEWDYFLKNTKTQVRKDVYNYMIITTNLFYKATEAEIVASEADRQGFVKVRFAVDFNKFFNTLAEILHPTARKPKPLMQELATAIGYVHTFNIKKRFQIPAVRFPNTEWFVAIDAPQVQIQLNENAAKRAKEQKAKAKKQLEAMLKKPVPKKVQESIRKFEQAGVPPKEAEKLAREQEQRRKQKEEARKQEEEARKEKELFERIEKMRIEQEQREGKKPPKRTPPKRKPPVFQEKKVPKKPKKISRQLRKALEGMEDDLYDLADDLLEEDEEANFY